MTEDQTQPKKSQLHRVGRAALSVAVIGAVVVTLAMVNRAMVPYGSVTDQNVLAMLVPVAPAVMEDALTVRRRFVGVVEARRESHIGFELGGQVDEVLVDEGDQVEEGQVLARLDTVLLDAERVTLLAARAEVASRFALARLTRDRVRRIRTADAGAVSSQALDKAETHHDALVSALARADAAVAQIDARLVKAVITAPYDGIVAERHLDEGQIAPAGAPVIYLLEASKPEARIGVAGSSVAALKVGDTHEVTVGERLVTARIASLLPVRNARTRTVEVRLVLDGTLHDLRRGDLVAMEIDRVRQTPGIWLPLSALTESSRGLWAAYIAVELPAKESTDGATHRLVRRDVEIVHADTERVFVRSALADRDTVVWEGLQRLVPEQRVRLAGVVARQRPSPPRGARAADTSVSAVSLPKTTQQEGVR